MSQLTQVPFADVSFVDNPEPRCPCVLVLDVSGSMSGRPIAEHDLHRPERETAISTRLDAKASPESSFWSCFRPVLSEGSTPMGEAILEALELVRLRKQQYQAIRLTDELEARFNAEPAGGFLCRCARPSARSGCRARRCCSVSSAASSKPSTSCAAGKKDSASRCWRVRLSSSRKLDEPGCSMRQCRSLGSKGHR